MDDRYERDQRGRSNRYSRDDYDRPERSYGSQAEQFQDGGYQDGGRGYGQQDRWGSQMGDSQWSDDSDYRAESRWGGEGAGSYQSNDRSRRYRSRGSAGNDDLRAYAARSESYGGARADNGLGYFTSESQAGRDFSQGGGNYRSGRSYAGYGGRSIDSGRGAAAGGNQSHPYSPESDDRGFFEKAGDEIASWFGDEDAARRRRMDHRGNGPANYKRSDDRIMEDACDCLTDDYALDARNVQVKVDNGEVTLDGTVDSRQAKRRAEDLVADISGVGHVQNNLRVQDNTTRNSEYNSPNSTVTES